jgi:hypothetical protein
MQAELEQMRRRLESVQENIALTSGEHYCGNKVNDLKVIEDLRALLAGKVLCDSIAVDCPECSGDGYHWGRVNRVNKRIGCVTCNETGKLYAPADIGKEGGE